MNRWRQLALVAVLLVLVSAAAPALAVASSTDGPNAAGLSAGASDRAGGSYALQENETANETTTTSTTSTPTENNTTDSSTGRPEAADVVRILPVEIDSKIVSVETSKQGQEYNTSGPFALFSLSEPVEEAAIQQQGASATVLNGGQVVRIQYDSDAAPVGKTSLYDLQIWFSDGSSRSISLYASETSKTVSESNLKKYRPEMLQMLEDAEKAGYERSPDGLEAYYEDQKATAELLDNLFAEQAARLLATLLALVRNPLGAVLGIVIIIGVSAWILRQNRSVLEMLSLDSGKFARLRDQYILKYEEQQQTAADRELREVDGIGELGQVYWQDAFNVTTVAELAELARGNYPIREDGEIVRIGGVEGLDVENVDSSWIEPVCRANRLPGPQIALTHCKKALEEAKRRYGMGHYYDGSLQATRELLDELDESRDYNARFSATSRDSSLGAGPGAAGGDD